MKLDQMIDDVTARGVPFQVVAAKLPDRFILRAMGTFNSDPAQLLDCMEPYLAMLSDDEMGRLEWSQHRYFFPHYLVYGSGDIEGMGWPELGLFLFPHKGDGVYGDARRLQDAKLR